MLHEAIQEQMKIQGFTGMRHCFEEQMALKPDRPAGALELLLDLLKSEASYRQTRSFAYRLKLAKLTHIKSLEDFDSTGLPLNPTRFEQSKQLKFIGNHENVLIVGGSGSGKSHLALGLAHRALQHQHRVRCFKFIDLARTLLNAETHNFTASWMNRLLNFHFIVIDEMGYVPIDPKASPLLFELLSNLYEKVSVLITTHLNFEEWAEIFGNTKMTKTIIDRFTHHCLVLETGNKSWRLKDGTKDENREDKTQ
jgi:DNA replication protein DnaC